MDCMHPCEKRDPMLCLILYNKTLPSLLWGLWRYFEIGDKQRSMGDFQSKKWIYPGSRIYMA
jgi:hypothetical protein